MAKRIREMKYSPIGKITKIIKDNKKRAEVIRFGGLMTLLAFFADMINSLIRRLGAKLQCTHFKENMVLESELGWYSREVVAS